MKKKRLLKILPLLLVAILSICVLTACVDADFEVQRTKMTGLGYVEHDVIGNYASCEAAYHYQINDEKGRMHNFVFLLYFKTDNDAIEFEKGSFAYSWRTLNEEAPEIAEIYNYKRIGKIFIYGTAQGLDDALS